MAVAGGPLRLWAFLAALWAAVVMAQWWGAARPVPPPAECLQAKTDEECFTRLQAEGKNPFDVLRARGEGPIQYGRPVEPVLLAPYLYWAFAPPLVVLAAIGGLIWSVRGLQMAYDGLRRLKRSRANRFGS